MTTFNPFASVVLSIAICSCFTLVPQSLSLLFFCSPQLFLTPPASPRNLAPEPPRPNGSPPRRPARTPPANLSSPPCAPPRHHNRRAKAVRSKPHAVPSARSFPALDALTAEAHAQLRAASFPPRSSGTSPLPSGQEHSPRPSLPTRDK